MSSIFQGVPNLALVPSKTLSKITLYHNLKYLFHQIENKQVNKLFYLFRTKLIHPKKYIDYYTI